MPVMRFSIWPGAAQPWEDIREISVHCEQTGWDGVYIADPFMPNHSGPEPRDGDMLECWSLLAGLAVAPPRVRLGPRGPGAGRGGGGGEKKRPPPWPPPGGKEGGAAGPVRGVGADPAGPAA